MAPKPKLSPIDMHAIHARLRAQWGLWRLVAWGGAAACGLMAVAFASQTETGSQRLQMAFSGASHSTGTAMAAAAERRAEEAQAEVRRLAAEVSKLSADRARLDARLAGIERDFNDLTGALGQKAAPGAKPAQTAALTPTNVAPLTPIAPLSLPGGVSALAPWAERTPQPKPAPAAESSEPHPVKTIAVTRPFKAQAPAPAATETPSPPKSRQHLPLPRHRLPHRPRRKRSPPLSPRRAPPSRPSSARHRRPSPWSRCRPQPPSRSPRRRP